MLRCAVWSVFGGGVAIAAALVGIGYEVVAVDQVTQLAGRVRGHLDVLVGGSSIALALRLGGPAVLAAARERAVEAVRSIVAEAVPGKR